MSKHFTHDMEALERKVLSLSSSVEEMINHAMGALRQGRADSAEVVFELELDVDRKEVEIENECLKILALHHPVAVDLRSVATMMKVNNDLERIADLAVNLAERAIAVAEQPGLRPPTELDQMVTLSWDMVRKALDAFFKLDPRLARSVLVDDDELDRLNEAVIQRVVETIHENPASAAGALHLFSASRHIERIGDHATNIAEDVIFLVEGEIARHQRKTQPEARRK